MLRRVFTAILILGVTLITAQVAQAEIISLRSGIDAANFVAGPSVGSFAPGPLPFAAADAGAIAPLISPTNGAWKSGLTGSAAKWIGTSADGGTDTGGSAGTGLYSQAFSIGVGPAITSVTLDFSFLTDNDLGDARLGVHMNGMSGGVAGSNLIGSSPTHYQVDQAFGPVDITSLVVVGSNRMQVYGVNTGGPSGILWDAKITVTRVPEPTSFALFGLAMVGFARRRR